MHVSDKGLAFIARHEGIVLDPYLDSVGVWTIGLGHTAAAGEPDPKGHRTITTVEAIELFRKDIAKFEAGVEHAVTVPLAQHEFDALVSFHFNSGGIARAKLTQHLNAGDRAAAAHGFMGWIKPPEIKGRRTAERNLFRDGTYGSGDIPLYLAPNGKPVRKGSISSEALLASMGKAPVPKPPPVTNPINPQSSWAALWRAIITAMGR